ncbi:MAG: TIGR03619 family F420-dependent LLM class oxidoreductase [Acidimicrobiales bacterium]
MTFLPDPLQPTLCIGIESFARDDPSSWSFLFERARLADSAGVDRLIVSDHVVFGEQLEDYGHPELGGVAGGVQPTGPDGPWLEPMTVLAAVSSVTSSVRLATGVLQAALRRPVVLAKAAATLDVLSEGRFEMGVGVGWQSAEYEAAGLDFQKRGRLLDQTLEVCRELWSSGPASFDSEELSFSNIHCRPRPLQPGGVPIWVSGTMNRAVIRRVVRFGSGWIPWGAARYEIAESVDILREALSDAGRDPSNIQVRGLLPSGDDVPPADRLRRIMDAVPEMLGWGVTDFRYGSALPRDVGRLRDELAELVRLFRQSVGRSD